MQQTEKKLKKILWIVRSPNWWTSDLRNIATIIQANDETEARSLHSWWLVNIIYNKYFFCVCMMGKDLHLMQTEEEHFGQQPKLCLYAT